MKSRLMLCLLLVSVASHSTNFPGRFGYKLAERHFGEIVYKYPYFHDVNLKKKFLLTESINVMNAYCKEISGDIFHYLNHKTYTIGYLMDITDDEPSLKESTHLIKEVTCGS